MVRVRRSDRAVAIPSPVTAINADFDGQNYLDRLMVGDLGGNIWRFDIDDAVPANWRGLQLASLSNNPAAEPKRKFFFPPAVALQNATGFDFHEVVDFGCHSTKRNRPLPTGARAASLVRNAPGGRSPSTCVGSGVISVAA